MSLRDRFAICGLGVTKQGKMPGVTTNSVRAEAAQLAIRDAGLKADDIDGYIYQVAMEEMCNSMMEPGDVVKRVGMKPNFIWRIEAGGVTCASSILAATAAIDAGTANYVLCLYGSCDLSHSPFSGDEAGSPWDDKAAFGLLDPGSEQALSVRRHMHEYGTTHDQLGAIAVTQRANANLRPDALMHKRTMTLDDYHNSRWVVDPYHLFDFCLINDGGVGFIVTTAERARDLKSDPVFIMGLGFGSQVKHAYGKKNYTTLDVVSARDAAFKMAGVTLDDIDVTQFYDCFTGTVLFQTEGYGFCKVGEGGPFWEDGNAKPGGKTPINTSGGSLSWGYNQGFTPMAEAVRQLRGEGAATQVKDAEVALATGHGTNTTGVMEYGHSTIILRR